MAYLYRHIRLDTNQPFYIGIGSDSDGKYIRANNKKRRSFAWKDIVYKNIQYEIDIILDNLSWEEACFKEKEFISLYGRKDLNLGPLVNFTDGGEGQFGRKDSEVTKMKKRKPKSEIGKLNMKLSHKDRDYSYLKGNAGSKPGVKKSQEHKYNMGLGHKNHEYYKKSSFGESISKANLGVSKPNTMKPIIQYDKDGNFIKEWPSGKDAAETLLINKGNISSVLTGYKKSTNGFIFKYKIQ